MCGIAGVSLKKKNLIFLKRFSKIIDHLAHRGPDSHGIYEKENVKLIHTRLSIVDIDGGAQPIKNEGLVLIANGEIYNDLLIRKETKKYKYKTKSDSESILAVYKEYGIEGFKKLRGMFSFAIYDEKKNVTILGRDLFGIKPLYFSLMNEGIVFSSEIQSIKKTNLQNLNISENQLLEFFQLQYCSGKKTIFKEIQRVRPGEIIVIKDGKITISEINNLPKKKENYLRIDDDFIFKNVKESVEVHLRSDVPYCLFYSGGIDSTLIMYFMKILNLNKKICAYSVNFVSDEKKYNHSIKSIANRFNIEFNQINFKEEDFWSLLPFAAKNIDEPIADYAILPTFKMASEASKNFKVALSGEGGDELFAGYGRYKSLKNRYKGAFRKMKFLRQKNWDFSLKKSMNLNSELSKLQSFQYFDYLNWLPNNLLVKLDRCLMAYGMEGRTPLIDKKLFAKFFYLDDKFKQKKGYGKYLIRSFLRNKIKNYNSFSKKKGFTLPIEYWIPKKSKYLEEFLPKNEILKIFFNEDEIRFICRNAINNKKMIRPLWHMIFISIWYLVNIKKVRTNGNFFDIISNVNK
ncbi:MAG: asparagine synthase (glutamine-hydrolyzing) [Alphaproteobacteria bacterium]|nr:asparagine synthase (glutamine-hydrolyzing) [Alphaproteobacteria bacterium]